MNDNKKSFNIIKKIAILLIVLVGLPLTNQNKTISVVASVIRYLEANSDIILNGSFESDPINSNYEYKQITNWNSVTHNNKTLVSRTEKIPTYYFVEINSDTMNSYYKNITLEQNKNYTFDISHRAHIRNDTTSDYTFDELAIYFGPEQTIAPSQNSNNKDQFMQMSAWLKENTEEIAGNNISNQYTVYSSKFAANGSFQTQGFSFTKTSEYTEKWIVYIVKSSTYNFFDYTVTFNSEELQNTTIALSSVLAGYKGKDQISYGNIVRYFKLYDNTKTIIDFNLEKIYENNQDIFTTFLTKGYETFDALNGSNPPAISEWWNVTEKSKKIEYGYVSAEKNAYSLQEISKLSGFEGKQFIVADNIYQNVNIGDNKKFEISFITKSLNLKADKLNRIYVYNADNIPSMNSATKKTQLDLVSEYLNNNAFSRSKDVNIIYTAPFASNGLFTVPLEDAISYIPDDIHTVEISIVEYACNVNDMWKKKTYFIELTDASTTEDVSIYFNSHTYAGESNLLDKVEITYTTEKEFLDSEFDGEGTKSEPYLIKNEEDFIKFRSYAHNSKSEFTNLYFKQTADIYFTSTLSAADEPSFDGEYDGAGYILYNLDISSTSYSRASLFRQLTGTIKNLGIKNATISGWSTSGITDTIDDTGTIENCFVQAKLIGNNTTTSYAAAIASSINKKASIKNVYFYGIQDAETKFGIGAYRAYSTPTFINAFTNINPNIAEYSATGSNPTITNSETKTLTEMQSSEFLNELLTYSKTNNELVGWTVDSESGLPTLEPDVLTPVIKEMYVKTNIDDNNIYWIHNNGEYNLYLSKNIDRSNMVTNYTANSNQITLYAYNSNNELLGIIENDTPNNYFENDKVIIRLEYKNTISNEYVINVLQSDLPSVYLNLSATDTETPEELLTKINADVNHDIGFPGVAYIRDSNNLVTTASFKKMKGRGNATWTYSKRPYQVKFNSSISMLGMKESNTWLFITNYTDGSLTRSAVFYKLAQELGIDYAIEFETADVYINGRYNGTYLVTSKVEKGTNRVDIAKNDSLIEIDNYTDTFQITSTISNHKFTLKYPDLEDETSEIKNQKLQQTKELIDNLEEKIYNQNVTYDELSEIIDMESFAKAYWMFEISENYDAMYGSTYIYTKDNLIHMGPMWDFDNTLNMLSKNNTSLTDYYLLGTTGGAQAKRVRWFNELMKRQEFSDLIDKVFLENIDTFKNLANDATEYNTYIQKSALMNYSRYPYNAMKAEKPYYMGGNSFEEASNNLIQSINTRVNFYLNEYKNLNIKKIKYTTTDVNNNTITETLDITENLSITLPNTVIENAEIKLVGITRDNIERELPSIKLNNGIYQNKIAVTNEPSINCDKKTNRNLYQISFERTDKEIKEIKIITEPNKTEYYEGDSFDKTGMVIHVIYSDDTSEEITEYTLNKMVLKVSDTNIVISYKDKTISLPIIVNKNPITGIKLISKPTKLTYIEGEKFDPSGLKMVAIKENGTENEIKDYKYNTNKLSITDTTIKIEYLEFFVDIDIIVNSSPIKEIIIIKKPTQLTYIEGQKFNPSGMKVFAIKENGMELEITDYNYNKNKLTNKDKSIEITYENCRTLLTIKVTKISDNIDNNQSNKPITNDSSNNKVYNIIFGESQIINKNNNDNLVFEIDANPKLFKTIKINGFQLKKEDYTINKDKLLIEITSEYLSSLENSENKVEIILTNDQVLTTKIFIKEDEVHNAIEDVENNKEETTSKKNINKFIYYILIIPIFLIILFTIKEKK